jgi:hypothetical protein
VKIDPPSPRDFSAIVSLLAYQHGESCGYYFPDPDREQIASGDAGISDATSVFR